MVILWSMALSIIGILSIKKRPLLDISIFRGLVCGYLLTLGKPMTNL
jgi:hypothetical protein